MLKRPVDALWSDGGSIAIGIAKAQHDARQLHVGLVMRDSRHQDDPSALFLHLRWHRDLRLESWNADYFFLEFANILPEVQELLVDHALIVATGAPKNEIPWSATFAGGAYFDAEGNYIDRGDGSGLTCATFILAVFETFGIKLVDLESWPAGRLADQNWLKRILKFLERVAPGAHIARQLHERRALRRYRPEEVAVTAELYDGKPLPFKVVQLRGSEVAAAVRA